MNKQTIKTLAYNYNMTIKEIKTFIFNLNLVASNQNDGKTISNIVETNGLTLPYINKMLALKSEKDLSKRTRAEINELEKGWR